MKKNGVAIATWTGITSLNYGSTLQAVALQELLRRCGYSPRTINYCPQYEKNRFRCYIKRATQLLNKGKKYLKTYMTFQRYMRHHLKCSSICYNFTEVTHYVKKNCSILLSGSDAVWWEGWMHSDWIGPLFLWKLPGLESYPKIAYAPSLLMGEIADELKDELSKYNSISVREKSSYDKIVNIIDRDITVVLDPVLTVPESFWNNQATRRLIDEEYVLAYFCSEAEMHRISIQ